MREEARERISDIVYREAMNDGILDEVIILEVEEVDRYGELNGVKVSPALAYLLMDELRLGGRDKGLAELTNLRVTWHKPERHRHDDPSALDGDLYPAAPHHAA